MICWSYDCSIGYCLSTSQASDFCSLTQHLQFFSYLLCGLKQTESSRIKPSIELCPLGMGHRDLQLHHHMTLSDGSDFYLIAAKPHFWFFMCAFSKGLKDSYWHSSMVCLIQLQVSIFVCLCGLSLNRRAWEKWPNQFRCLYFHFRY